MRGLPSKYRMPERLWRHGISSLLEIFRGRHPTALVAFIDIAYPIITDLLEKVPEFEKIWTENLGDLFRYRMSAATTDGDWDNAARIARQWYLKTATQLPETGRLYHHLGIVARPDQLQQFYYNAKSLGVPQAFTAARKSMMTVLNQTPNLTSECCSSIVTKAFLRSHALILKGASLDTISEHWEIKSNLDGYIANITKKYLVQGYYIAICNIIALLGYGAHDNPLGLLLERQPPNQGTIMPDADSTTIFAAALCIFIQTTEFNLLRIGDMNILSFLHVTLVFIRHLSYYPSATSLIFPHFPWNSLVDALNAVVVPQYTREVIGSPAFPGFDPDLSHLETPQRTPRAQQHIEGGSKAIEPYKYTTYPFPEDRAMRGLPFAKAYFPEGWFTEKNTEPDTHYLEAETTSSQHRPVRVLWLGVAISRLAGKWMGYGGAGFFVGEKAKSGAVTTARHNGI